MQRSESSLPDDNRHALRGVVRSCRKAALATCLDGGGGAPYVSLVTVAFDLDLSPILLLSKLADHTRNLGGDPRASLLLDGTDGHPNPQTGPRVTLTGTIAPDDTPRLRDRFLAIHPAASLYAGFGDFAIWRMTATRAHFVGGFGRAVWFDAPFGLAPVWVAAFLAGQTDMLDQLNHRHAAALAARDGGGWQVTGVDPDGFDLHSGDRVDRIPAPRPMADLATVLHVAAEKF